MKLRVVGLLSSALLTCALAACGADEVVPSPDVDSGETDAGPRDASLDAGRRDAFECPDFDGDGYGAPPCGDDCDDHDSSRYPGATEVCDLDDEDCDPTTYGADFDGDGYESARCCNGTGNCGADCDDRLNTVNPGAAEQCNGGIDDDCDGLGDAAEGVCTACPGGYSGFDGACTDMNECLVGGFCGTGSMACDNRDGTFACSCVAGYRTAAATGALCEDIDECADGTCGAGVTGCVNSAGSYTCTCGAGFTVAGAGAPCVDIDECATGTPCGASGSACGNIAGTYVCTCNVGYAAPATGGTCVDADECTLGTDDCGDTPAALCTNLTGSFVCTCPSGYVGTGHGVAGCIDINECAAGVPCGAGLGTCENRTGTYACTCGAGYEAPVTGGTCVDIDECAVGADDCDDAPDACLNTVGGFTCACPAHYVGSGRGSSGCGPQFTDLGGGVVRDNGTGLVWQQALDTRMLPEGHYTQVGAIAYCTSLSLAGGSWRLPTKDELLSIVDFRFIPPFDPTYFPGTPPQAFWTSSSVAGSPGFGWCVNFNGGGANVYDVTVPNRVRCAR